MPSQEDQATATGNRPMCRKFKEVWTCGFWRCVSEQTDKKANKHTYMLIAILRLPTEQSKNKTL